MNRKLKDALDNYETMLSAYMEEAETTKRQKTRIAELELEVAARDRVLGKIDDISDISDCTNCRREFGYLYSFQCAPEQCVKNMIALARAEIKRERGK